MSPHPFYQKSKLLQWSIAILLLAVFSIVVGIWVDLTSKNFLWYFGILFLVPILQFTLAPILTLFGVYTYLSPMLLVYNASEEKYDLHNGTGFDYLFSMRDTKSSAAFRQKLLSYYLEGFLAIIQKVEKGTLPESVEVHGTSYFFSKNTVQRLGFQVKEPTSFYVFNLYFNYIELISMYSLAHGKLTFPNLKNIKLAVTTGGELVQRKAYIQDRYGLLQKRLKYHNQ